MAFWLSQPGASPKDILKVHLQGTWVAQSVKHLTSAQLMISRFVGLSPTSGSVLTAQSLEPASILRLPLFAPPPLTLRVSLSLSLKNK